MSRRFVSAIVVNWNGKKNLQHYIHYSGRGMSKEDKEELKASSADHVKGKK